LEYFVFYLLSGIAVGLLAGLFGVGGGIIMVPILTFSFAQMHFPESILLHTAIGTSLTTILFTSFSSLFSHHRNGSVIWKFLFISIPWIILGTYLGSFLAASLRSKELNYIFIIFIFLFAIKMLFGKKKDNHSELHTNNREEMEQISFPKYWVQSIIGILIGFSSALVGVGGGVFTSTYLLYLKTPIHRAIGTSAAIGFPIALSGGLSYIINGWNHSDLPNGSTGFVYWPAVLGLVVASMPFAYLGAKISHRLPKDRLRILFAFFLLIMGTFMTFR
jgi:uncharacterized membrane protein YfcA